MYTILCITVQFIHYTATMYLKCMCFALLSNCNNSGNSFAGNPGPAGFNGQQGFTGESGLRGFQGQSGFPGATGATGFTGPFGSPGVKGIQGSPGNLGVQGRLFLMWLAPFWPTQTDGRKYVRNSSPICCYCQSLLVVM